MTVAVASDASGHTLLVKGAEALITMDADRREIRGGSILLEGDTIASVGPDAEVTRWIPENPPARTPIASFGNSGAPVKPYLEGDVRGSGAAVRQKRIGRISG